jgi:GNAT superfamily N-acetyltransferase
VSLQIEPVRSTSSLREFIRFPWHIYRGDRNWVPPLLIDQRSLFNKAKHPFYDHGDVQPFLARRDGRVVGRIAAIINRAHNKFHKDTVGFFGFFEAVDDGEVAQALFKAAEDFVKANGMTVLRGPMNFSTNEECGLLVEGLEQPPVIMMTYNPRYYINLLEDAGFQKAKDLLAYKMTQSDLSERLQRMGPMIEKRLHLHIRKLNMKDFWADVWRFRDIYNKAWESNWGFVPMTDAEFHKIAKDLKLVVDPDLVWFAENSDGQPIGVSLALPDFNQALAKINGRLLPFGIFKLLYLKKHINGVRVYAMGVIPEYRRRGVDAVFYWRTYEEGVKKGHTWGEFSWILEDNEPMKEAVTMIGAKPYKVYRIYDRAIGA